METDSKPYDLEERSFQFALSVRSCIGRNRWSRCQWSDVDQVLRSSGSVAANYIEANNAVSTPDFLHKVAISKKEVAESRLWLRLLGETSDSEDIKATLRDLHREADELTRILATIFKNSRK